MILMGIEELVDVDVDGVCLWRMMKERRVSWGGDGVFVKGTCCS
jgi:hypothetical protein